MPPDIILTKLHTVISSVLDYSGHLLPDFKLESRFTEDLGADSLDHVEIIIAVEEEFGLNISDEDAEAIITVQQAVDYLTAALQPAPTERSGLFE